MCQCHFSFNRIPTDYIVFHSVYIWCQFHQHFPSSFCANILSPKSTKPIVWNFCKKKPRLKCWWNWPLVSGEVFHEFILFWNHRVLTCMFFHFLLIKWNKNDLIDITIVKIIIVEIIVAMANAVKNYQGDCYHFRN